MLIWVMSHELWAAHELRDMRGQRSICQMIIALIAAHSYELWDMSNERSEVKMSRGQVVRCQVSRCQMLITMGYELLIVMSCSWAAHELWVMSCELWAVSYGLWAAHSYELWAVRGQMLIFFSYELWAAHSYELWVAHELLRAALSGSYELWAMSCSWAARYEVRGQDVRCS